MNDTQLIRPSWPTCRRRRHRCAGAQTSRTQGASRCTAAQPKNGARVGGRGTRACAGGPPDYRVLRRLQPCLHWPRRRLADIRRLLVLDTETTGGPGQRPHHGAGPAARGRGCRINQPVGAVQVYDGLEDPGMPSPGSGTSPASPAMVRRRGPGHEARIAALLLGADLVVAHNAGFDRPLWKRVCQPSKTAPGPARCTMYRGRPTGGAAPTGEPGPGPGMVL